MELQKYVTLLGASKIIEDQAIDTSYDPAEASPATALVEEEPGSGPSVASDEPEVPGSQAVERTEGPPLQIRQDKPDPKAEKGPVDGEGVFVDQRSGFLKKVAGHFDELTSDADQAIDGETDQESVDSASYRARNREGLVSSTY
jgi:hypothetical protein